MPRKRKTQKEFIEELNLVWGSESELDFSQVEYVDFKTKVIVGTRYGDCLANPASLLNKSYPSIQLAISKTSYCIN